MLKPIRDLGEWFAKSGNMQRLDGLNDTGLLKFLQRLGPAVSSIIGRLKRNKSWW